MARLRRNALIAVPILTLTAFVAAAVAGSGSFVPMLSVAGAPGSLAITNPAATVLTIARPIAIERLDAGRWIATPTSFNADAVCPARTATVAAAVTIAPRATLHVQPWHAYSCSRRRGQNQDVVSTLTSFISPLKV